MNLCMNILADATLPTLSALEFIFDLAVILLVTKLLGLLMRKIGLPEVLGFILAGILVGPAIWGAHNSIFPIQQSTQLKTFAEVGVILVLFTAGLETDLKKLKSSGLLATLVALGGVIVPLGLGTLLGLAFHKGITESVFIGTIMTATSVAITVATLSEMGKLNGKDGTIITSAAIIDDVIGMIVLSVVLSIDSSNGEVAASSSPVLQAINPNNNIAISILWMLLFFVLAIAGGFLIHLLFKHLDKKSPNTHRIPIFSLVVCFAYAYIAEEVFGVADITGAYIAGVIMSANAESAEYADKKLKVNYYTIFGPLFFANIGIAISFKEMNWNLLLFGVCFVIVAIMGKIIGCGLVAKCAKYNNKDCLKIGAGMIARGEVALVVANKGINAGIINSDYLTTVILLVLVSSILAPILLKLLFKTDKNTDIPDPTLIEPTNA